MRKFSTLALGLILVSAGTMRAQEASNRQKPIVSPEAVIYDEDSAFQLLKTLVGEWQKANGDLHEHGDAPGKSASLVTFRSTGGGSALIETINAGEQGEMTSVFHRDGKQLLLTHYCVLRNAPILKFEKSDKPGEIKFVFLGGTNFDPKVDEHVHGYTFYIKDRNTVEQVSVDILKGKLLPERRALLKAKSAK